MEFLEEARIALSFAVVPIGIWVLFRLLGRGGDFGILGIVGGLLLLALVSTVHLGLGLFLSSSCSPAKFYTLTGGVGCAPVVVASCYALIMYGLINVAYYFSKRNS